MTTIFEHRKKSFSGIEYNSEAELVLSRVYRKFNPLVPGYPTDRPNITLIIKMCLSQLRILNHFNLVCYCCKILNGASIL